MIRSLRPGEQPPAGVEPRRYVAGHGYIRLRWPLGGHHYVECYEHRWVMGNPPAPLQVHHRNGDKTDNRPANLEVLTPAEHQAGHHRKIDRDEAKRLYELGQGTVLIGRALGHDPAAVYRALKAEGVVMRPPSRKRSVA